MPSYYIYFFIICNVLASWGPVNRNFSPKSKKKSIQRNKKKTCQKIEVGQISNLRLVDSGDGWNLDFVVPTKGNGSVDFWIDLDGNGVFEGFEDSNNSAHLMGRPMIPGYWEHAFHEVVTRDNSYVLISSNGKWSETRPLDQLDVLMTLCSSICLDFDQQLACDNIYYRLPMQENRLIIEKATEKTNTNKLRVHTMQSDVSVSRDRVPENVLDHDTVDATAGIIIGCTVSLIMVVIAISAAVYLFWKSQHGTRGHVKEGETADRSTKSHKSMRWRK